MLFVSAGISELEIPGKKSLVIYISECQNKCHNCHTPYMNESIGTPLMSDFQILFEVYSNYFDVLCIMGEGKCNEETKNEIEYYCKYAHEHNKEFALYIGRNCGIEEWMNDFDYVKVGAYIEKYGALTKKTTNQKLYKISNNNIENITSQFWK